MFKKLTKFIVNQTDPKKELVPVESIAHNEHFRPFYLLKKKSKPKTIFHPAPYYQRTGFTLEDVLLPGKAGKITECLLQDSCQFTLTKTSADQAEGRASVSLDPASVELQGAASMSNVFSIKLQKKSISLQSMEALIGDRQINTKHSFIRQLESAHLELYVVTEILEASEETIYKASTKADWAFNAIYHITLGAQGTKESNQGIVIPKGCTLAFRVFKMNITNSEWVVQFCSGPPKSFNSTITFVPMQEESILGLEEVKNRCRIFSEFSRDLMLIFLNTIKAVMRDRNLLQELSHKMEEIIANQYWQIFGYNLNTESPHLKDLYSTLQHSPRGRLLQLARGITNILDALHELMDNQLLLLLESLERKIVSQQLNLVANLLEHDQLKWKQPFRVDAGLLSFPHKEEQALTIALLELSGVQLQEDGSALPRDQPFEDVAALFVALYTLNLLSGSE